MTSFLRQRTEEGARLRYTGQQGKPTYERARTQLERELRLNRETQTRRLFSDRVDIVQFCKYQGILIQGAARQQTALSVIHWVSPRSIRGHGAVI